MLLTFCFISVPKAKLKVQTPSKPVQMKSNTKTREVRTDILNKPSVEEQITRALSQIETTFTSIFQALLVLDHHGPSNIISNSELEQEKQSKRSREFESCLKRSVFEGKQKVLYNLN